MDKKNLSITDNDIASFQIETDKVLKEYCLVNIENLKNQILMLKKQVNKMDKDNPALRISQELLLKNEEELKLYLDELKYLDI